MHCRSRFAKRLASKHRHVRSWRRRFESLEIRVVFSADFVDSVLPEMFDQPHSVMLAQPSSPLRESGISQSTVDLIFKTLTRTASASEYFYPLGWQDSEVDGLFGTNTAQSTAQISLDDFRSDVRFVGVDGTGFSTVIIDTGIDLDHPFFGPDVAPADGISDRIVYSYDFSEANDSDASDFHGHGSNVSSIVASSDITYRGMAPGASVIHLKVFPDSGGGASYADIEEALQWTVANTATFNIASVNLSLGGGNVQTLQGGPLSDEFAALSAMSVVPVVASGNDFFSVGSVPGINVIAADPNTVSVGAVYDANIGSVSYGSGAIANTTAVDRITPFTQRHASLLNILAPGASITGANQSGGIVSYHGTSQASPHISGIAVLAQQFAMQELGRRLTIEEFRGLLRSSGVMLNDGDDENDNVTNTNFNFPRVDVLALGDQILDLRTASISGRVFEDQNGDGLGAGDPGLDSWSVYIDDNNNGLIDSGSVTVNSTDGPLAISTVGSPAIRSTIAVSGIPGLMSDLNVTLNIGHTWNEDLRAYLMAPNGRRVELFSRVGGDSDDFTNTTFNDEAASSITTSTGPFAGDFRPEGALSDLDGSNPNGIWTLEVVDDFNQDGGSLNSWSLTISASERSSVTPENGSFTFSGLTEGTHLVRQVNQSGYTLTSPVTGVHSSSLLAGGSLSDRDFGNYNGTPSSVQLILPMYQYPLSAPNTLNSWWQQALEGAGPTTPLTIIANPNSGPLATSHPDYANWITGLTQLQANPFVRILGYVKTRVSPGSPVVRTSTEILTDVALYESAYKHPTTNASLIDGIFLDEMSNIESDVSTYVTVANGIRGSSGLAGQFIAANPGTTIPIAYLDQNTADLFVIREGTPTDLLNNAMPSYVTSPTYSALAFGAIVHSAVGSPNLAAMLREVKLRGLDYAFITDDSGANPFDQAPTYFSTLLRDIHAPFIATTTYTLPENSLNGTIVGTPVSGDPDPGQTLAFSIVGGNIGNAFTIASSSGQLSVNTSALLDFETNPSFSLTVQVDDNSSPTLSDSVTITVNLTDLLEPATILSRRIFYNGATLVGGAGATGFGASGTPGASFAATGGNPPETSIDTSKSPLLPGGNSVFTLVPQDSNYSNVVFGLNGIVVDIANTTGTITAADFSFATGETLSQPGFTTLIGAALTHVNPQVTHYAGGGVSGSTRAKITFDNHSLRNIWLKVTVLSSANTGLAEDDVFYFGNVVGDVNGSVSSGRYTVNAIDTSIVRVNQSTPSNSVLVTNLYDFNKSGNVNAIDTSIVRTNQQASGVVKVINNASIFSAFGGVNEVTLGPSMSSASSNAISILNEEWTRAHRCRPQLSFQSLPGVFATVGAWTKSSSMEQTDSDSTLKSKPTDSSPNFNASLDVFFAALGRGV